MSVQDKYVSLLELANQNGTTYTLSEADGVLNIDGTAPSAEAKQQLWDEYERLDPDFKSNDLSAAVAAAGIVRTKDLKTWERLDNLKTLRSPQQ